MAFFSEVDDVGNGKAKQSSISQQSEEKANVRGGSRVESGSGFGLGVLATDFPRPIFMGNFGQ